MAGVAGPPWAPLTHTDCMVIMCSEHITRARSLSHILDDTVISFLFVLLRIHVYLCEEDIFNQVASRCSKCTNECA